MAGVIARPGRDLTTLVAFGALVTLVGMNLVAIRFTNRELAPTWNAAARFLLAAGLFIGLAVVRRAPTPSRRIVAGAALYGLFAHGLFFAFVYTGMVRATAGLGQTVLALGPLITLLMAAAIGLERFRVRAIVGAIVSLAGIGLAIGAQSQLDVPIGSVLALVAAATSFAAGSIVAKRLPPIEPALLNAIATGVGGGLLLAISAVGGEAWSLPQSVMTWLAFGYLVVPGTVIIFLLFLHLLRRWSATAVSYQFVLAPVVAIVLGALLLGEPVGPGLLAGAAIVVGGVWIGAFSGTERRMASKTEASHRA